MDIDLGPADAGHQVRRRRHEGHESPVRANCGSTTEPGTDHAHTAFRDDCGLTHLTVADIDLLAADTRHQIRRRRHKGDEQSVTADRGRAADAIARIRHRHIAVARHQASLIGLPIVHIHLLPADACDQIRRDRHEGDKGTGIAHRW